MKVAIKLILWLTPFEAASKKQTSARRAAWEILTHLEILLVPMPSTEMELPSMSKPLTTEEALIKTFAISVWWGTDALSKPSLASLITDPFLPKQTRKFTLKCRSHDRMAGLGNWGGNYLNDVISMNLNDENAFWNNGWSCGQGEW